jgi:CHAT domain-containing protein
MTRLFLENILKKQMPFGDALHQAKLDMISNPDTSHPWKWASPIFIGDPLGRILLPGESAREIEKES